MQMITVIDTDGTEEIGVNLLIAVGGINKHPHLNGIIEVIIALLNEYCKRKELLDN